jgi:type I restriction-modification system DNA methylase subunit
MPAPEEIIKLVERFERNIEAYRSGKYNETQVRVEFVDPFFKALGWDVENKKGHAERYKDVIHEAAIKVGGNTKAPDYSFRVGGMRKFFLEAKKPSVNLKDDTSPAFQVRRYAWSAKLPISILTDFEELAVYDCRNRPSKNDTAATSRVMYFTYQDYISKWDLIYSSFSKEAVMKGDFDKLVDDFKKAKGTQEVDAAFLSEIERWRETLARNLALRNQDLDTRELNFSVQRIIDRIIFLRIAEDRGIEPYGQLGDLTKSENIYNGLSKLFLRADDRYNSGLFHFKEEKGRGGHPDNLTQGISLDDKVLKGILKNLYYPESPYEFSVLSADILGQVYEQFLGKIIRLTAGHQAKIEEKPEVKKAGGVYYTPTYIVDYIVENTVGKLLEGKTPRQVNNIRVLDPACGSGSFLLGAYQFILDWHLEYYTKSDVKAHKERILQIGVDDYRLKTEERKRILLNNIYGVDIDSQAVEVTKLSLLLKVLEGENQEQISMFQERVLPSLDANIKCGNSLIGSDFYASGQITMFDMEEEERYRINVFDWEMEFKVIMDGGGFDAVIGNPPWGADFSEDELNYHRKKNKKIIVRMVDSFMYFVFHGLKKVKLGGSFGMILPDVLLYQKHNEKLRLFIHENYSLKRILNMGDVFKNVIRPSSIIIVNNENQNGEKIKVSDISNFKKDKNNALQNVKNYQEYSQDFLLKIPGTLFITSNISNYSIWEKVNEISNSKLSSVVDDDGIQRGVSPDLKDAFIIDNETLIQYNLEKEKIKKVVTGGKHVKRYYIGYPELNLIYTTRKDNFNNIPNITNYINLHKGQITCKEVKQGKHPLYSLHRPRQEQIFIKDKKLFGVITEDEIIVSIDINHTFATDGIYVFGLRKPNSINYLMGILNSKLFIFVYRLIAMEKGRVLAQVKPTTIGDLPIRTIDFDNSAEVAQHEKMVSLVETMLSLNKELAKAKTPQVIESLERQIAATDRQIDVLVYALYDLTDEEIKIVEESVG